VTEAAYQARLIRKLKRRFPGCEVLKNDASYRQGMLDLTVFWGPTWAMLEVKVRANAAERPNQAYYVEQMNDMSFAAFICPENEEEVLTALSEAFTSRRAACVP
jgi:Holliday junction resolvase-like predicted endonuclease